MSIFCRKSEERAQRGELILDIAAGIIAREGYAALGMQRIADASRYSKGTIYQHYASKEDIVATLVVRCGVNLLGMVDQACRHEGGIRAQVALVSAAFFTNAARNVSIVALVPTVKSAAFMQKVSQQHARELTDIDDKILQHIVAIFAEHPAELPVEPLQAAFGWWAMLWGIQDAMGKGWDLARLGVKNPVQFYFKSLEVYLDGLGVPQDPDWQDWGKVISCANVIFNESK